MLEALDVSFVYESTTGPLRALSPTTLSVARGEFVSVLGPSGCGKSTLLNLLGGLMPPTTGRVLLDGQPLEEPSDRIGFVFQEPVLLPWRTVLDNVLLPAQMLRRPGRHDLRARELLALVGLAGFEANYPRELSGGMRQRVALARALSVGPEVLLMDEPFGALDAINRERMNFELMRLWQGSGMTIVFVTHSIPEAVLLSDRVVAMTDRPGRIKEVHAVRLTRPRTSATMEDDTYLGLCRSLRALLLPEAAGA
ncbi:MAG TPA: ABC transporter ATP-binding protein [Methylomirabilota bacterium]|nr:ABC transporter ATP-binding protein [Methylomirabilota bacterium]